MESMTVARRPTLTVCILARNEERNIRRALESARPVADEILVVDTGSTDNTVSIALELGAKVIHHPWNDNFAEARNAGLAHATGEWVLMLDADEAISSDMARELPRVLQNTQVDAYVQPVIDYFNGTAWASTPVLRLFRNHPEYRYIGRIHEQIDVSILAASGVVEPLQLAIEHYGYTPDEDRRKDRRARNIRLLERSLAEEPQNEHAWYFLGVENLLLLEFGRATECFKRTLEAGGNSLRVVMAAHRLTQIETKRQRLEHGWEWAMRGSGSVLTRWDSALLTAQVAHMEGDFELTLRMVDLLRQAPPNDFGSFRRDPACLMDMEACAYWEKGDREKALHLWEQGAARYPENETVANHLVRHKVQHEGLKAGLSSAMRSLRTAAVGAACVGELVRAGEFDQASFMAKSSLECGFVTPPIVYGLAYGNHWELAEQVTERAGVDGALHLATAAAWFDRPDVLERALDRMTGSVRNGFELILTAQSVPEELLWVVDLLMSQWAQVGCIPLLTAAAQCLPCGASGGLARAAWLAYQAQLPAPALDLALRSPEQPDALEVLGLVAFDQADYKAAAHFLSQRVAAGPAPVRVYHKAIEALLRVGRPALARIVLETALTHRPQSPLLQQMRHVLSLQH